MAGVRERGRLIRDYILNHVDSNSQNIAQETASHFGISRQAVNTHISRLVREGLLTARGATRNRRYSLAILREKFFSVPLVDETALRTKMTRRYGRNRDLRPYGSPRSTGVIQTDPLPMYTTRVRNDSKTGIMISIYESGRRRS